MKNSIFTSIILAVLLLIFPLFALSTGKGADEDNVALKPVYKKENIKSESFKVLNFENGKINEMSAEDYITGVVAAEMPALYETEALKAQAVAAYSFALRRRAENKDKDYDITTNPAIDQSFIGDELLREKWGDKAEEYEEKIRSAVKAVAGQTVNYKGEVALTLYHAVSSGKTESSKEVWGGSYDYLVGVDSVWDKLSPNYLSSVSLTLQEFKKSLGEEYSLVKSDSDIKILSKSKNGSVKKLSICGKEISGEELRGKLKLKSLCFTYKIKEEKIEFTVMGYGHGVGMSQFGADYMAKQGADYKEILKHYYKGVSVG